MKNKRKSFRRSALDYFSNEVGDRMVQRIDGIACFSPLRKYWFWKLRLNLMVARGELTRKGVRSIWKSCDGMPAYGLPRERERA